MNIILLSGGSGTRLWPLSNEVRSKQFLKILKNDNGNKESMIQRVFRMIKLVDKDSNIVIATSENQVPQIIASLSNNVNISIEPCRKDTFPAISLSCFYLEKSGVNLEESVIVTPVDSFVDDSFFKKFVELSRNVNNANLTLLGIKPTYPSEKFGYILPNGEFIEKPSSDVAKELINKGALWNGGVFAFKLGYMIGKAKEILKYNTYNDLLDNYDKVK
ncbi:MAG: mannose-1-phosphate guanylyltransferase, partial [Lachnospiraceae bacterium]|nr:mannose-1-phosphate guanylyltransferase [Lachnospiraceae bacterium]